MTRITNFRYKRTYIQAGLDANDRPEPDEGTKTPSHTAEIKRDNTEDSQTSQPPKKKRKRTKSSKGSTVLAETRENIPSEGGNGAEQLKAESSGVVAREEGLNSDVPPQRTPRQKRRDREKREKEYRLKALEARKNKSESRRMKRISEKKADTTCFACREKGHAAKDCPTTRNAGSKESGSAKNIVGICYRCGSSKHTLSRCKKPIDSENPMPFASCFVCSEKGHLASSCPKNKDKGVYPNGGCCKLCGETTHLAKNCNLRKKDDAGISGVTVFGTGQEAGADEDDFHTFKRRKTEVDKEEKRDAVKQKVETKVSRIKPPLVSKPRKVVNF